MTDMPERPAISVMELQRLAMDEARLVRAAALRISTDQKQQLTHLGALQMHAAIVGDIDMNLDVDLQIEHLIGEASGMPDEAKIHAAEKAAFKAMWRDAHALRDAVPAVEMRVRQIECIVASDAEGAAELSRAFFGSVCEAL
ncbi:MAG: hypothetical protein ACRDBH_10325 [Bosea sp. (in: a-proteobacteria)]